MSICCVRLTRPKHVITFRTDTVRRYICTVVYFPLQEKTVEAKAQKRHYHIALGLLLIGILGGIILAGSVVAMVANFNSGDDEPKGYASSLGILSALITIAVWMPQIYTTWKMRVSLRLLNPHKSLTLLLHRTQEH